MTKHVSEHNTVGLLMKLAVADKKCATITVTRQSERNSASGIYSDVT